MIYLGVALLAGFITVLFGGSYARKYLLSSGIYGVDQQKDGKPKVPTSGGVLVLFGFIISITLFMGLVEFFHLTSVNVSLILAALSSVNIIALIGLIDDIHMRSSEEFEEIKTPTDRIWSKVTSFLGDEEEKVTEDMERVGLSQLPKMLFVLPAALPLIAVGAGSWTMYIPIIGTVNWGIIYPLVLLPLGLLFVSNVVNMLAGTNGLSAGISMMAGLGLGTYALLNGKTEAALIALSLSVCMLAFMRYNFYPASLLPGDSLTYLAGAALFASMVIGNMEKFGVFVFAPYFLEFFLKARSGFQAHSWGVLQSDGRLKPQHDRVYSLTHPLMRKGFSEKEITLILVGLEAVVVGVSLLIFQMGLV
ncbi:MAG: hypothetical protein ABEJ99_04710 [Candidatus Nanohaloarchaea archaeon]